VQSQALGKGPNARYIHGQLMSNGSTMQSNREQCVTAATASHSAVGDGRVLLSASLLLLLLALLLLP